MASKSFGVTVTVGGVAVGGLLDANITGGDVNHIDVTNHESEDANKEFIGGLTDNGTLELSGHRIKTDVGQIYILAHTAATASVVVTYSDGVISSFSAVIGKMNTENPLDAAITFKVSLKISGVITDS